MEDEVKATDSSLNFEMITNDHHLLHFFKKVSPPTKSRIWSTPLHTCTCISILRYRVNTASSKRVRTLVKKSWTQVELVKFQEMLYLLEKKAWCGFHADVFVKHTVPELLWMQTKYHLSFSRMLRGLLMLRLCTTIPHTENVTSQKQYPPLQRVLLLSFLDKEQSLRKDLTRTQKDTTDEHKRWGNHR